MKKAFSIIALCMAIILCIPSVPSFASGRISSILTGESTNTRFEVGSNEYKAQITLTCTPNYYYDICIEAINSFSDFEEYDYYMFCSRQNMGGSNVQDNTIKNITGFEFIGFKASEPVEVGFSPRNISDWKQSWNYDYPIGSPVYYYTQEGVGATYYVYSYTDGVWSSRPSSPTGTFVNGALSDGRRCSYVDRRSLWYLLDSNCKFVTISNSDETNVFNEEAIDYNSSDLMRWDGNGYVSGTSVSFSDTAYNGGVSFDYQQTHLYTEYNNAQGANETCVFKWALDSRSQSITQTTTDWKMHYYVVVNWHWTQATNSSVYSPLLSGGSGGQMAFEFDDVPEFIMQGKSKISIWDLVQNVPTVSSVRDEDIVSLAVAVQCLNGNQAVSVWHDIFGQTGQYVADVASDIISSGSLEVQGVGDVGGDFINGLFNPYYYYALDDLRVNLVAHPWSKTLGIHGGNGDFDLNLISNVSYGTTQGYVDDGGTPNDPSDDTQYPTNTVPQQNNVVIPVTYPTSGGNVTVYSVVQVPDSGGGSSNSINYSPTFSPSIVMDSGLDDLKETVDAYPQVPNQHFWDYFLVFKDNAFLEATSDFFGALPSELSSLLISSIGIIGVFAIYRFVRRR